MSTSTVLRPPPLWACTPADAYVWQLYGDEAEHCGDASRARLVRLVAALLDTPAVGGVRPAAPKLVLTSVDKKGADHCAHSPNTPLPTVPFVWRTLAQATARWNRKYGERIDRGLIFATVPTDFRDLPPALALSWFTTLVAEECHRVLDNDHTDQLTRGLLADALEWQTGRKDEVDCLRWCAQNKKWPHGYPDEERRGLWRWWKFVRQRTSVDPDDLPPALWNRLPQAGAADYDMTVKRYQGRRAAEAALAAAWSLARKKRWKPCGLRTTNPQG